METIFDHNPTDAELKELFSFNKSENTMCYGFSVIPLPIDRYDSVASSNEKKLDLALLFELRGNQAKADEIWAVIPEIEREYKCGMDNNTYPI